MITVTPQAAEQIAKSAQQAGAGGVCLRLAARLDDKGVLEYGMGFDDKADGDTQGGRERHHDTDLARQHRAADRRHPGLRRDQSRRVALHLHQPERSVAQTAEAGALRRALDAAAAWS